MTKNFLATLAYVFASIFCFFPPMLLPALSDTIERDDDAELAALFAEDDEPRTWQEYVQEQVDFLNGVKYVVTSNTAREFNHLKKNPLQFARKHRLPIAGLSGATAALVAYLLLKEKSDTTRYGGSALSGTLAAALLYYLLSKSEKKIEVAVPKTGKKTNTQHDVQRSEAVTA